MNWWLPDYIYKVYPRFLGTVGVIGAYPVTKTSSLFLIFLGYSASASLILYSIYIFYQRFIYSDGGKR